jgi:predicted DNA-binding protein (MmcQ/YjbR family)
MSEGEAFKAIQKYCLAKPGAVEDYPWGDVAWKINSKMFACGGQGHNTFTVKSTPDEQAVLIQHQAVEKAAYVGRYGWVTVTVSDEETLNMAEDLIDESYGLITAKGKKSVSRNPE